MDMDARGALDALCKDGTVGFRCYDGRGEEVAADTFADMVGAGAFNDLTFDSRSVKPGSLFVCKGAAFKEEYLASAVGAGASAYVAQRPYACPIPGIVVDDVRRAMAVLAVRCFAQPFEDVRVVGITGTKGKTTTTFYLDSILRARRGAPSAMLTGVVVDDGASRHVSHNTTPESIELQRMLAAARDNGCDIAVMEVSSQGLKYDRTYGTRFAVGAFTNIGEDHISPIEHPTFEDYFASKLRIFGQCECAVVNADMDRAERVLEAALRAPRVLTYSMHPDADCDVRLTSAAHAGEGAWNLDVSTPRGRLALGFRALGSFNVSNALAAVAVSEALGIDRGAIAEGVADVHVPGRMERYDAPDGSVVGIVDYAHNGMSMEALLRCAREEFPGREVTVVFGATGERATHRREALGRAAGTFADRIILTEDDPGRVPVASICEEVGVAVRAAGGSYEVVENREDAVHAAVAGAKRPAVVLLAGKGAEDQILRATGLQRCRCDAELICRELGIGFKGYSELS